MWKHAGPFLALRAAVLCDNDQRRPRYWTLDFPFTKDGHKHKHKHKHKLRRRVSLVDCPVPVPVPIPFPFSVRSPFFRGTDTSRYSCIPYPASILGPSPISSLGNRLDSDSAQAYCLLFSSGPLTRPPPVPLSLNRAIIPSQH